MKKRISAEGFLRAVDLSAVAEEGALLLYEAEALVFLELEPAFL